jgi:hypothetical protein
VKGGGGTGSTEVKRIGGRGKEMRSKNKGTKK